MINGELWILLLLYDTLHSPSLGKSRDFFLGNDIELISEAFCCCGMGTQMVREASCRDRQLNR